MRRKTFAFAFTFAVVLAAGTLAKSLAQTQQWVEVAPPGGKFSVMMPTKPEESKKTKDDSKVGPVTVHLFSSKTGEAFYIAGWADYKPGINLDVQGEINANRDNFIKGFEAKLTSEQEIKIDGHPGTEFVAESEGHILRSRVYVVGNRPYMLITGWAKGGQEPPGVATFLYSFRPEK